MWARLRDAGASRESQEEEAVTHSGSVAQGELVSGGAPPHGSCHHGSHTAPGDSRGTEPQLPSAFDVLLVSPAGQTHPSQQGSLGDEVHTGQPHREQSRAEKDGKWS